MEIKPPVPAAVTLIVHSSSLSFSPITSALRNHLANKLPVHSLFSGPAFGEAKIRIYEYFNFSSVLLIHP